MPYPHTTWVAVYPAFLKVTECVCRWGFQRVLGALRVINKSSIHISLANDHVIKFLVADTQLYKRLGPFVGPSIHDDRVEKCVYDALVMIVCV